MTRTDWLRKHYTVTTKPREETMSVKMRQHVERAIAAAAVNGLLDAGYDVSVFDSEEVTLHNSTNADQILAAMFTTDEDFLYVNLTAGRRGQSSCDGWVRFVYGNDGWDVINDYTTNLEAALTAANARADYWEGK